jgi:hypothetical protein
LVTVEAPRTAKLAAVPRIDESKHRFSRGSRTRDKVCRTECFGFACDSNFGTTTRRWPARHTDRRRLFNLRANTLAA